MCNIKQTNTVPTENIFFGGVLCFVVPNIDNRYILVYNTNDNFIKTERDNKYAISYYKKDV